MSCSINGQATTPRYATSEGNTTGIFSGGEVPAAWTMSIWLKAAATSNVCGLYDDGDNSDYLGLRSNTTGDTRETRFRVVIGASAFSYDSGFYGSDVSNTWFLLVVRQVGIASRYAYIIDSGNTEGEGTDSVDNTAAGLDSLCIGGYSPIGLGAIDIELAELGIWNKALTTAEIDELGSKKPSAVAAANLQHYFPFYDDLSDDKGSITLTDINSNITFDTGDHPSLAGPSSMSITDVANSGETPGSGSETWDDGSTGNVITGTGFV